MSAGKGKARIFERSAFELLAQMEQGVLTSEVLTEYYLTRIKVYDGVLNSFITVNPRALDEARQLDAERRAGRIRGVLHGLPIVLKDNYDTCDMPTTSGALAFKDLRPKRDAFTVQKLRQAGALILGKTNLTELARHGMSISSMGGQTLNPYDLTRTPGGSSGGTGAAVAANFAVMGTGSDTMNSIRSPASACSLVGIRPTKGLVSRSGICPCSDWQDTGGPIARCVSDAALMLGVMAGYDPEDQSTEIIKDRPAEDYTKALKKGAFAGRTIAVITNNLGSSPEVLKVVEDAVRDIKRLGARILECDIPELDLSKLIKEHDVQEWEQVPDLDRYLAKEGDAAPVKNTQEYFDTGLMTPSLVEDFRKKLLIRDPLHQPEYLARLEKNKQLREFVIGYMLKNKIDAFMYPLQQVLAVKTTEPKGQYGRNGHMASVTGLPAIDVPGGFSKPDATASLGVPVGIEFMAEPFSESKLIALAYSFEQATHHRRPPLAFQELDFCPLQKAKIVTKCEL